MGEDRADATPAQRRRTAPADLFHARSGQAFALQSKKNGQKRPCFLTRHQQCCESNPKLSCAPFGVRAPCPPWGDTVSSRLHGVCAAKCTARGCAAVDAASLTPPHAAAHLAGWPPGQRRGDPPTGVPRPTGVQWDAPCVLSSGSGGQYLSDVPCFGHKSGTSDLATPSRDTIESNARALY